MPRTVKWGTPGARPEHSKGGLATWENVEQRLNLDVALGAPEDLTHYQDCIAGARAGWRDPLTTRPEQEQPSNRG